MTQCSVSNIKDSYNKHVWAGPSQNSLKATQCEPKLLSGFKSPGASRRPIKTKWPSLLFTTWQHRDLYHVLVAVIAGVWCYILLVRARNTHLVFIFCVINIFSELTEKKKLVNDTEWMRTLSLRHALNVTQMLYLKAYKVCSCNVCVVLTMSNYLVVFSINCFEKLAIRCVRSQSAGLL